MRLIELGLDLPVAIDLDWQWARDAKEAQARLKKFSRKTYGRVDNAATGEVALGEDTGGGARASKAYCGGALVALAEPNAFIFHELPSSEADSKLFWVCGVRDGLPVHSFDAVLTQQEARAKYTEFVSFNASAQVYGSIDDAKATLPELFEGLQKKQRKPALLRHSGVNVAALGAFVLVPVVVGAVALGYFKFEEARKRQQLSAQEMIARQAASESERRRIEALRASFDEEVAAKKLEIERQPDTLTQIEAWVDLIGHQVPISHKGWQPLKANCAKTSCTISWRPDQSALPVHIRELPGRLESQALTEPTTSIGLAAVPSSIRQKVNADFKLELLSYGKLGSGAITPKADPRPVQVSPDPGLRGVQPVVVGTVGSFSATFTNVVALREFARWLQPYAVAIDRLEAVAFTPAAGGSPSFSLEARYVVGAPAK